MTIALGDEQSEFARIARQFLYDHDARGLARMALEGADGLPPFWGELAALGWLGLHVPERFGGSGFGLEELAVVLEAQGHEVAPGPFLPTVLASAILCAAAPEELGHELVPGLVDGSRVGAVGLRGDLVGGDGRITGDAGLVMAAGLADLLLLVVGDDVVVVERDAPGLLVTAVESLDPGRALARVELAQVSVEPSQVLFGARRVAVRLARSMAAIEATGTAHATTEMAAAYAKERIQFGRVIATFQAVKHHCADMRVRAEQATAVSWDATRETDAPDEDDFAAAAAIAVAATASMDNAEMNVQLHGGIAYTWEHDAHLFLRRAGSVQAMFGPVDAAHLELFDLVTNGATRRLALDLPAEAEDYRSAVRAFRAEHLRLDVGERRAHLVDTGYLQPHWPRPWGRQAGPVEQLVIDEELDGVEVPGMGIGGWVTLTLATHGTADQGARWIRRSMMDEDRWCQLFSEPNAGSDAANVETRATRVDGGWVVNGQKVWTSGAHECNWGWATVRTAKRDRKHDGITMMAIDLRGPGVEVRPLRMLTGQAHFNEVFLTDVFVPDDDVVGPVDGGWAVARATLGNERVSIGAGDVKSIEESATRLVGLANRCRPNDRTVAASVGRLLAEDHALRVVRFREVTRAVSGGEPSPTGNITKLLDAEGAQHIARLGLEISGEEGATGSGEAATWMRARSRTIAGGTSEISRNQIAERLLGLPRDPLIK